MDRASTGVKGFDELIEGGFPRGSTILITGAPGTGKTIFALTYLCEGAAKGENGIYVVIDSGDAGGVTLFKEQAVKLNLPVEKYENEGKITFLRVPLDQRKFNLFFTLDELRKKTDAKRIVFDSVTTFMINLDLLSIPVGYTGMIASSIEGSSAFEQGDVGSKFSYQSSSEKRLVFLVIEMLRRLGTTNLVVAYGNSNQETETNVTTDGVSEFACDGVIAMYNSTIGSKHLRTLSILKMRSTSQTSYIHNFEITNDGIVVKPAEEIYK